MDELCSLFKIKQDTVLRNIVTNIHVSSILRMKALTGCYVILHIKVTGGKNAKESWNSTCFGNYFDYFL